MNKTNLDEIKVLPLQLVFFLCQDLDLLLAGLQLVIQLGLAFLELKEP